VRSSAAALLSVSWLPAICLRPAGDRSHRVSSRYQSVGFACSYADEAHGLQAWQENVVAAEQRGGSSRGRTAADGEAARQPADQRVEGRGRREELEVYEHHWQSILHGSVKLSAEWRRSREGGAGEGDDRCLLLPSEGCGGGLLCEKQQLVQDSDAVLQSLLLIRESLQRRRDEEGGIVRDDGGRESGK
jgi:hypothetical protein